MVKMLSLLFILICAGAFGQQNSAAHAFFDGRDDCAASLGGWRCLELDLSSEIVEEEDSTKIYEYSWDFGDGNRLRGTRIEHCYAEFGSYQVTMDLLDMETNTVIRNELSATVHLYPEIYPSIKMNTENQAPSFISFSYDYEGAEEFTPDHVYWRIDGSLYEGSSIVHPFPVAGVYLVEMGMEKDMGFLGTVSTCATREVTIKDSDVWTGVLRDVIHQKRTQSETGPFATDEIFCRITDRSGTGGKNIVTGLDALMSQVFLEEGKVYDVFVFSGNIITEKIQFSTQGNSGSSLYVALKDTITSLLEGPLAMLGSLRFDSSIGMPDTLELKKTADILLKHPYLQVEVGSYMHTGSRFAKGLEASLVTSAKVKGALVKLGISANRVSVASPEYNRALVNTCSALPDCGRENRTLNGKVEFKITGCL